jgi:preprotein translocase subunit SecA
MIEWVRANFGVDLRLSKVEDALAGEIEQLIKERAKKNAANDISISIGEYLEDYADRSTWNLDGLTQWAMSAFGAGLSASKLKHAEPEEIEEMLVVAAAGQIDKKDFSQLNKFLRADFAIRTFAQWARDKFDVRLDVGDLKDLKADQIRERLTEEVDQKYKELEIAYPVGLAVSKAFKQQGANISTFESLAEWANKRYNADLTVEKLQETKQESIYKQLLELSRKYHKEDLQKKVHKKVYDPVPGEILAEWSNEYFETDFTEDELVDKEQAEAKILAGAREFLRKEFSDIERYVLVQIYDITWKDHLYSMDHLKENIFMRAYAEKDPKIEYKHEGFRMFNEMLEDIKDKVTDDIFKVRLDPGAQVRSVWNVSQTKHDEVGQFAIMERQRAAGTAPQGERKVKQIELEYPKVRRNEPCPCGSGKKYKKCCGKNA